MTAFGVYIHWPFCGAICPYCDFNVRRDRGEDPEPLIAAIEADIAGHGARFREGPAQSVFFGGGTPSRLSGGEVARLIGAVERAFGLSADAEISLEANPEDQARFADHAAAGINRFSIGVQALDDPALRRLGRFHAAQDAVRAAETAAGLGKRVSIDLIYAREGQDAAAWRKELDRALALPIEHLSLYQLTIEAGTPFARAAARGRLSPPDPEAAAALFEETHAQCAAQGFDPYEISNFARGAAAQARHNLLYWRTMTWAGVGPGAHGRLAAGGTRLATAAHRGVRDYIAAVARDGVGWSETETLSGEALADEALLMGLRLAEGADRRRIEAWAGRPLDAAKLDALAAAGLLTFDANTIRLSPQGRLVCDRIALELSPSVPA